MGRVSYVSQLGPGQDSSTVCSVGLSPTWPPGGCAVGKRSPLGFHGGGGGAGGRAALCTGISVCRMNISERQLGKAVPF